MVMKSSNPHSLLLDELHALGKPEFQELCMHLENHLLGIPYPKQNRPSFSGDIIASYIYGYFPTYFASAYHHWRTRTDAEFIAENDDSHQIRSDFLVSLDQILEIRNLLMDFLPFLFMISLNRMPRVDIERIARNELIRSVNFYEKVYHHGLAEIDRGLQLQLLTSLLDLFRILDRENALTQSFVLYPLLGTRKRFGVLFPNSFDTCLKTLDLVRILLSNDALRQISPIIAGRIYQLSRYSLNEIISILVPVFKNYFLIYVDNTEPTAGTEYLAVGTAFSGIDGPKTTRFLVKSGHRADYDRLATGNLYLINRIRQIGETDSRDSGLLTPNDYLNLTPFVIYTIFSRNPSPGLEVHPKDDPDIFVFYSYEPDETMMRFLGLNERRIIKIMKTEEEYRYLFDDYDIFLRYYKGLLENIKQDVRKIRDAVIPKETQIGLDVVRGKTWDISLDHLSTIMHTDNYNENGTHAGEMEVGVTDRSKYREDLYISPPAEKILDGFFQSGKMNILFIGKAGIGKTNLLCAYYLLKRREGELALFLDTRRFANTDIRDSLVKTVAQRINENWNLSTLNDYLINNERILSLFIDAVNEYSGPGGPLKLLQELISFINSAEAFSNLRIIATCRSETWFQYIEETRLNTSSLLSDRFFTNHGNPFSLEGFESEESRRQLYKVYQQNFALMPASFDELSPSVKDLIQQPSMMRLVAETYTNKIGNLKPQEQIEKKILKNLDYFRLFQLLTERKIEDARRLLPIGDMHQSILNTELPDCLYVFAQILLRNFDLYKGATNQIEHYDSAAEKHPSDTVSLDVLYKDIRFKAFLVPINQLSPITIFDMAIQVGLVEKVYVPERDYWGNTKDGRAYKFFHDQYAQYWLSAIYSSEILGSVSSSKFSENPQEVEKIIEKIAEILFRSNHSPVLAGALDHWLYANMCQGHNHIRDYLLILLDLLAQHPSSFVRHYTGSYIYSLIEKSIVDSKILFRQIINSKYIPLKDLLANHLIYVWQTLSPEDLRLLIEAYDELDDDERLRRVGDTLADAFFFEPYKVCKLLDEALNGLESVSIPNLTQSVLNRNNLEKQIAFMAKFTQRCVLGNISDTEKLSILRTLLVNKYRYVVSSIIDYDTAPISLKSLLRNLIYGKIEAAGINSWDQAIGSRDHNNQFFSSHLGIVQRDVLYDYYKFWVAYHNGDTSQLSLEPGSEFRSLSTKMMMYSQESVIGYVASLILAVALTFQQERLEEIVDELTREGSIDSLYNTCILLANLAFLDVESCPLVLKLMKEKVIPWSLSCGEFNTGLVIFASVVSINNEKLWNYGSATLGSILDAVEATGDNKKILGLTDSIVGICFVPDLQMGTETATYMIKRGFLKNPKWYNCVMTCLACLYTRNPKLVKDLLMNDGNRVGIEEVKGFITPAILEHFNLSGYQASWNQFIVSGLSLFPKLRYYLIKVLLAGFIQSNSVEEVAREFRRFVIETARGYLENKDDGEQYAHISLDEALSQTESRRVIDGGKEWQPSSRSSKAP